MSEDPGTTAPTPPPILGSLAAAEVGEDLASIEFSGTRSIPPTDALYAGVGFGGPLRRLAEKANARRDAALVEARSARARGAAVISPLAWSAAEQVMLVRPTKGRVVNDINGVPYPPGVTAVPVSDVYAHRRLRDGSLVLVR